MEELADRARADAVLLPVRGLPPAVATQLARTRSRSVRTSSPGASCRPRRPPRCDRTAAAGRARSGLRRARELLDRSRGRARSTRTTPVRPSSGAGGCRTCSSPAITAASSEWRRAQSHEAERPLSDREPDRWVWPETEDRRTRWSGLRRHEPEPPPRGQSRNPVDRLTRGLPHGLRVTIDWVVTDRRGDRDRARDQGLDRQPVPDSPRRRPLMLHCAKPGERL